MIATEQDSIIENAYKRIKFTSMAGVDNANKMNGHCYRGENKYPLKLNKC